ncbi:hypothetical protein G6F16_012905 [Rhizopus arrhizus]|nr:hypothetical protein G6F16_012905 [Rhizopus arrhizus]KAG0921764.1 hypothetical protein G6F32_014952 [Rhizopus arrhizus]
MRHQEKSQQEDSCQDDRDVVYARALTEEKTTKEDSELSDQEATKKEQNLWDKTQEDSEVDQTRGMMGQSSGLPGSQPRRQRTKRERSARGRLAQVKDLFLFN